MAYVTVVTFKVYLGFTQFTILPALQLATFFQHSQMFIMFIYFIIYYICSQF